MRKIEFMHKFFSLIFIITTSAFAQNLTLQQANHLATLPIKCLQQEYPNKLSQLLIDSTEIASPKQLHPAFYGCFDWHSSVHGHWSLVYLLNNFPNLDARDQMIQKLQINLSKENINQEIIYLSKAHEKSFERTYGWAWLLKLQMELETSQDKKIKDLAQNLQPLSDLIVSRYIEFLPKLNYPIRAGTHANSAFGMNLAWDYAVYAKNEALRQSLTENAIRLYQKDENCPFDWEPSGTDFLSPCLEELGIMQRVLPSKTFLLWLKNFAPKLFHKNYDWRVAEVSDRTDGHLVHLDGLNFSRAWNFYYLIQHYPKEFSHLKKVADTHLTFSLPSVVDGNYEGEHWLASFALRSFEMKSKL